MTSMAKESKCSTTKEMSRKTMAILRIEDEPRIGCATDPVKFGRK